MKALDLLAGGGGGVVEESSQRKGHPTLIKASVLTFLFGNILLN